MRFSQYIFLCSLWRYSTPHRCDPPVPELPNQSANKRVTSKLQTAPKVPPAGWDVGLKFVAVTIDLHACYFYRVVQCTAFGKLPVVLSSAYQLLLLIDKDAVLVHYERCRMKSHWEVC